MFFCLSNKRKTDEDTSASDTSASDSETEREETEGIDLPQGGKGARHLIDLALPLEVNQNLELEDDGSKKTPSKSILKVFSDIKSLV